MEERRADRERLVRAIQRVIIPNLRERSLFEADRAAEAAEHKLGGELRITFEDQISKRHIIEVVYVPEMIRKALVLPILGWPPSLGLDRL